MIAALLSLALSAGAQPPAAALAAYERYSVLTAPGPEEPTPAVLAGSKRLLYGEHKVKRGEYWAGALAKAYGTTLSALQATNNNEFVLMYPGMKMTVHNGDGQLYLVKNQSESLDSIIAKACPHSRLCRDAKQRPAFKELVVRANDLPGVALLTSYELERGERLLMPGVSVAFDTYRFPFESQAFPRISSRFGFRFHPVKKMRKFHEGLDIPKPYGTPVYAARSGRVLEAGWHEGYGQLIVIRHDNGETTRYGHLSKILIKPGDIVQRGKTMIGRVGSTGISTGPHLHFEVRDRGGKPLNPTAKIGRR